MKVSARRGLPSLVSLMLYLPKKKEMNAERKFGQADQEMLPPGLKVHDAVCSPALECRSCCCRSLPGIFFP